MPVTLNKMRAAYHLRLDTLLRCRSLYPAADNATCRQYQRICTKSKLDPVRIGCASGFWGDTPTSVPQLVHGGNIDFLVSDYLSEITMSLLAAARKKNPDMGYTPDFVHFALGPWLADIKHKGIRVVSNAGGINPAGCAAAIKQLAKKHGIDLKVAMVTGDNIMDQEEQLSASGITEMQSGKPFPPKLQSMNAYLGAGPIAQALDLGADVVVTGRCVDSALALGPLMHQFRIADDDFDMLAAGSLAGHLIECGAQCTGGIFTDWDTVPDWDNIGFPIAECYPDGQIIITKPPKTGGIVTTATVAEQLVYEIGDPENYKLPDVVCDFTGVTMQQVDGGVKVTGAKGKHPGSNYKVSATYMDGFRATAVCTIGGPRAAEKGRRTADAIMKRCRRIFKQLGLPDFSRTQVQILGAEDTYGPHARSLSEAPREAVVWMSVHHQDEKPLQFFSMEIASAGTGMAPGLTGLVGGRPKPTPVLRLYSFLYPKEKIKVDIHIDSEFAQSYIPPFMAKKDTSQSSSPDVPLPELLKGSHVYTLRDLAYTRSGDKGDTCNIGAIARHASYLPYIRAALTSEAVANYFAHVLEAGKPSPSVVRYDLPGIHAVNFVLEAALGGGGVASLRSDPQGKAFGQMLLDFTIRDMPCLEDLQQGRA